MTPEERRAAAAELARQTTAAQGLPEKLTDPVILARVAALFAPWPVPPPAERDKRRRVDRRPGRPR